MVEETLLYHAVTIKIFLAILFINLLIPIITKSERAREVKWTRISFFFFSGLLTMIAFSGVILMMVLEMPWNLSMTIMLIAFVLLTILEIARSRTLHKIWMLSESGASISWKFVLLEIVIVAMMVILMIMEKKGAISLS